MCGNGGRCALAFAAKHDLHDGRCAFLAVDGVHEGYIAGGRVHLEMAPVDSVQESGEDYVLDTGSPHYVKFDYPGDDEPIVAAARKIRYQDEFKANGINVNFVQLTGPNSIKVRTYERGVEDETFSCGTGVVASAISTYLHQPKTGKTEYEVLTKGGRLKVSFHARQRAHFSEIWLIAEATYVYAGELEH
jgi:diaminopimelate epimerase